MDIEGEIEAIENLDINSFGKGANWPYTINAVTAMKICKRLRKSESDYEELRAELQKAREMHDIAIGCGIELENEMATKDHEIQQLTKTNSPIGVVIGIDKKIGLRPVVDWHSLPEVGATIYTAPVPAMPYQHDVAHDQILKLIESVRKHGIERTGCEPSVSGFHCAVDELRMALENLPAGTNKDDRAQAVPIQAINKAIEFIENGIEFGYIRMPDAGFQDSAHQTLPLLKSALEAMPIPKQEPAGSVPHIVIDQLRHVVADAFNAGHEQGRKNPSQKESGLDTAVTMREMYVSSVAQILTTQSPRITEQDAREIARDIFGYVGIANLTAAFDNWFDCFGGRALLKKLNANTVAEVRQEPDQNGLLPLSPHDHTDCQVMIWSNSEIDAIKDYASRCIKASQAAAPKP